MLDQFTPDGYARYAGKTVKDPIVVPTSIYPRVVRGGSWIDPPELCRSACRTYSEENWKEGDPQFPQSIWYHTDADFVGFRVVRPFKRPTPKEARPYDLDKAQIEAFEEYEKAKFGQ